jgi:hypothetical protein
VRQLVHVDEHVIDVLSRALTILNVREKTLRGAGLHIDVILGVFGKGATLLDSTPA